jgi:hypothetical protein
MKDQNAIEYLEQLLKKARSVKSVDIYKWSSTVPVIDGYDPVTMSVTKEPSNEIYIELSCKITL